MVSNKHGRPQRHTHTQHLRLDKTVFTPVWPLARCVDEQVDWALSLCDFLSCRTSTSLNSCRRFYPFNSCHILRKWWENASHYECICPVNLSGALPVLLSLQCLHYGDPMSCRLFNILKNEYILQYSIFSVPKVFLKWQHGKALF